MATITDATMSDAINTIAQQGDFNDFYTVFLAVVLVLVALFSRHMFRKMYINLNGGRKDG